MTEQPDSELDGRWIVVWSGYGQPHFYSYLRTFGAFDSPEDALTVAYNKLLMDEQFAEQVRKETDSPGGGRFYAVNTGMFLEIRAAPDYVEGNGQRP